MADRPICGHCGNRDLTPNVYEVGAECLQCGWTTDSPSRTERDAILAATAGNDRLFSSMGDARLPTGERINGSRGKYGEDCPGQTKMYKKPDGRYNKSSEEMYMRETILMWWTGKDLTGWSGDPPVEIPVTVVYRRSERKPSQQNKTAMVEEMIFDLRDVPWPSRKFWETVRSKFQGQTGLRLLRLSEWLSVNQPVEEKG